MLTLFLILLSSIISIPLIIYLISYLKNKFYIYIISNVYINGKNKLIKECYIRYHKKYHRFEFLVQISREDWDWEFNCNTYTTCNKNLYGDAWDDKFDLQEYDGYLFIDKATIERYITLKEKLQEKTNLSINKYTKYDRLKYKVQTSN